MNDISFRRATEADWPDVAALLESKDLPLDGAQDHLPNFTLARAGDGSLAGVAGLERYGDAALLRSVAVAEQNKGLGTRLVNRVLADGRASGLKHITLLTTRAQDFFPRFGFRTIARDDAPDGVKQSVEFTSVCPASSITMQLDF